MLMTVSKQHGRKSLEHVGMVCGRNCNQKHAVICKS